MSDYNKAADIAEKQLKFISPTMCYAKWVQTSINLTSGTTHSCYHPPMHSIDVEELTENPSALHNTKQKKSERKQMLNGERPEGCAYCWKIEDVDSRSDRIYRSGEYWAQNARADIADAIDTGNITPRYVEVNFNQACNFKCSYCSPHLSTTWEDEVKQLGAIDVLDKTGAVTKHNDIDALKEQGTMPLKVAQAENPYIRAFWEWWPELYKKLEVFRMTGGEPLMDSNMYKVLDYIYKHPNNWLEVSVTSNMCPPKPELMDKFIEKMKKLEEIQIWEDKERWNPGSGNNWYVNMALKNFALFVSVDSVGKQAEYIRTGLDFAYMDNNIKHFLNETANTTVTFINTFNLLSVPGIKSYLEYILKLRQNYRRDAQGIKYIPIHDPYNTHPDYEIHPRQRIWFDLPVLRYPQWQSTELLPESYCVYLEQAIEFMEQNPEQGDFAGFYDFEVEKLRRNLNIMQEGSLRNSTTEKRNFYMFFKQHDERRSTNFVETFPELADFYNACKVDYENVISTKQIK
jgi:hypothetical protein